MRKELPVRPSLEHLKSQAKDVLEAYHRGEHEALARFRDALPAACGVGDADLVAMKLALHDAQSVIAREYGFESWNELRQHVEQRNKAKLTPEALRALMERHMSAPLPREVQESLLSAAADRTPPAVSLRAPLPLIPIRNAMLAAGSVLPLNIGRPSSIAAIKAARDGAGTLAMFAQKTEAIEAPREEDLHPIGCAVRLLSLHETDDRGLWIVVRAVRWIRLDGLEQTDPYLVARVSEFTITDKSDEAVKRLHDLLLERVRAFAATLPGSEAMLARADAMTPLELADATVANLQCSVEEKAHYAGLPDLAERLRRVIALFELEST